MYGATSTSFHDFFACYTRGILIRLSTAMHEFSIKDDEGGSPQMHVTGSTFAGLLTGALQGLATCMHSAVLGHETSVERQFSCTAKDAVEMSVIFLQCALAQSATHDEIYDGVRFTLVTPTKAEGVFLGKKIQRGDVHGRVNAAIKKITIPSGSVAKNEQGMWETTIALQ